MSDEQLPEVPPPATTPAAAPAQQPAASALESPEVKAFVAAEVERVRNATWKQARETIGKKSDGKAHENPPAQQPPTPPAQSAPAGLTFADIVRYDTFKASLGEHAVPPAGAAMLLERFMAAPPADARAWVAEQAASFGWTKPTGTTTPSPAGSPAPHVAASVPAMPATPTPSGSPPASSAGTYDVKPSQMKPADVAAYVAKNGPKAFSALVRQELAGTRLAPPPRR